MNKNTIYLTGLFLFIMFLISCETLEELEYDSIFDTWLCEENSEVFGNSTYYVDISEHSSDSTVIIIDNFYNLGYGIEVTAQKSGLSLTIPSQVADGNTITGNGYISANYRTINFSYTVNDGSGELDHVTAVYTRER
ncbi:MAG: hypothetical protein JSV24_07110 [Bacteroidales bacterium]|nr:MAG: hypothetical protein JSV24_07110 [Bacteroidales bacterium]